MVYRYTLPFSSQSKHLDPHRAPAPRGRPGVKHMSFGGFGYKDREATDVVLMILYRPYLAAAGSYDQRCRVLNHVTWRAFAELAHPATVRLPATAAVYREVEELTGGGGIDGSVRKSAGGVGGTLGGGESTMSWWAKDGEAGGSLTPITRPTLILLPPPPHIISYAHSTCR
jgi:uncharacterized membrane protein YgcG